MSDTEPNQNVSTNNQPTPPKMTVYQKARLIFLTLLGVLLITFILQNSNKVKVEFLNIDMMVSIIMIILISAVIGGLITFLWMKQRVPRKKKELEF